MTRVHEQRPGSGSGPSRVEHTDVVVVGAGPAGLATALACADAGADVVLVEAGDVEPVPGPTHAVVGGPRDIHRPDHFPQARRRALGGTSHAWRVLPHPGAADHVRLATPHAHHLAGQPALGVPAWPLDMADLTPHLPAAARFLGVREANDTVSDRDVPALGPDWTARWHQLGPADAVRDTAVRAATAHAGIRVRTRTEVVALRSEGDRILGVVARTPDGPLEVQARDVVLAMGTMEVVRLLLTEAAEGRVPDPNGWIGQGVIDHPHLTLGHLVADPAALPAVARFHDAREVAGRWVMGHQALSPAAAARERLPDAAVQLTGHGQATLPRHGFGLAPGLERRQRGAVIRTYASRLRRGTANLPDYSPGLGGWSTHVVDGDVTVLTVHAMIEDRPSESRRVRAAQGHLVWDWAWRDDELEALRRLTDLTGRSLEQAGLGVFLPRPELRNGRTALPKAWTGWHHMGGARMGASPEEGVLTSDLRHQHVEGLHVASGAAMPTSVGAANPTLTIVALALRLGAHIAATAG